MRDISKNIKSIRTETHMTQEEFAEKLFVTRQTVSNYENGRTRPDIDMLIKMADIFDTDVNTIIYGKPLSTTQKADYRRLAISGSMFMVLFLAYQILCPMANAYGQVHYNIAPTLLVNMVLFPCTMLVFGWFFMQGVATLLKVAPLKNAWVKQGKSILVFLVGGWMIAMCPFIVQLCIEISASLSHSDIPNLPAFFNSRVYNTVVTDFAIIDKYYPAIYAILGGLLWMFDFPKKCSQEEHHAPTNN